MPGPPTLTSYLLALSPGFFSVLQSCRTLFFVLDFDWSVHNVLIHSALQHFSLGRTFWLRPMGEARGRAVTSVSSVAKIPA